MAKLVAIDAGTTGVRALVVDEQARVVDVAYRELTQHFPSRAGWSTTPTRSGTPSGPPSPRSPPASPRPARPWPPSASPTSARPSSPSTAAPAGRCTGPSCGRTAAPRRSAPSCAEPATSRWCAPRPGLVLDPYFSATKAAWLLATATSPRPDRPRPLLLHRRHLGPLEPHRRARTAASTPPTLPTPAARSSSTPRTLAWSPELCDLFGVPAHTLPEVRPSAGRFGTAAPR